MKKGWEIKKLSEVCQFINGRAYNKQELLNEGKYTVLRVGNFFTSDHWYYSDLELDEDKYCDNGDLLYAWSASFGPKIWDGGKVIYHYHIWKVVPNENLVTKEFLYHFLDWDKDQIKIDQGAGTTMTHVSKGSMDDRLINIPPLPEQQRIVSVLDESFASIAQAKSNAEQNLVNARELFESVMEEIFGNGKDWVEKKLFEIGNTQTGTTPKTSEKKNYGDYIPFIKPADIDVSGDGEIRYDNEGLSETGLQNGRLMSAGSVLMVCIGASIGKVGFANRDVSCNQQINAFTVNKPNYPKFFYYALRTQGFYNKVIKNSAQATLPIINKSKWENLTIRFPESLVEQRAIVGRLEALSAETGRLEEIYQQKVESLEELKKSVLAKAFEGEL